MIAYLCGRLLEKHPNQVIVDVHGVGYEVVIPVSAYSSLPEKGAEVRLHIHTHVREADHREWNRPQARGNGAKWSGGGGSGGSHPLGIRRAACPHSGCWQENGGA